MNQYPLEFLGLNNSDAHGARAFIQARLCKKFLISAIEAFFLMNQTATGYTDEDIEQTIELLLELGYKEKEDLFFRSELWYYDILFATGKKESLYWEKSKNLASTK